MREEWGSDLTAKPEDVLLKPDQIVDPIQNCIMHDLVAHFSKFPQSFLETKYVKGPKIQLL